MFMLHTLIKNFNKKVKGTKSFLEVTEICYLDSIVMGCLQSHQLVYIKQTNYLPIIGQKLYLKYKNTSWNVNRQWMNILVNP